MKQYLNFVMAFFFVFGSSAIVSHAEVYSTIPIATILVDGNPGDWAEIPILEYDDENDDPICNSGMDMSGLDIKSYSVAHDGTYLYIKVDFYDGTPNLSWASGGQNSYQIHLRPDIEGVGVYHDGSEWRVIDYFGAAPGSYTACDSVLELAVPLTNLHNNIIQSRIEIGTGIGLDETPSWMAITTEPDQTPENPELTVATNGINATISWNSIPGATGYTLFYAPYPNAAYIENCDMGNETSLSVDFWNGAAFYVAIKARNSAGYSSYSNIDFFVIP